MTMPANSHPAAVHRPPAWAETSPLNTFNPSAKLFRACRTAAVISSGVAAGRAPATAAVALVVVRSGHLQVRVMFRSNALGPSSLTPAQMPSAYFHLYYHFIKHAVGLLHRPAAEGDASLRLYFDQFPGNREAATQFHGFILGLKDNARIRHARLSIQLENIAEIRSHEHVLAQCLDVVLGAMAFHLNGRHQALPAGSDVPGKRTVAKETLFKAILAQVENLCPGFDAGVSTPTTSPAARWHAPYLHWSFTPDAPAMIPEKGTGPTQPT